MHGDDIGLEVVPEAVKVIKAAAAKTGLSIEWTELLIGKAGHERRIPMVRLLETEAHRPFEAWQTKADRVRY